MIGPDETSDTPHGRLKSVREKELRDISHRDLAALLRARGVDVKSHSTVGRYERGQQIPPADYVREVVKMAGVSGHWLLTGTGERHPADPDADSAALAEIAAIIDRVRATSADADGEEDAILATPEDGEDWATKIEGE